MYSGPFKWWVQSVMPLVFDDSLSYYEVLAKLTKYIEGLKGDVEQIEKILGTIEGIEDVTQFTEFLENIQTEIGNLSNLSTNSKTNLVSAINEVALKADIAYPKPVSGIPESDLSQAVQDKLNRTGEATKYIINNKELKAAPNNNSPADLGLGTYSVPSGGIPWDTLSQDVRDRIENGSSGEGGTKDYNELNNKPQINGHTLNAGDNTLENLGLGTYSKPSGGIPESDLSAGIQEKLNTSGGIADSQVGFTASRDYEAGELLYINGVLYRTKVKILSGTTMIPGNNIETTDISAELESINSKIEAMASGEGLDSWSLDTNIRITSFNEMQNFFEYFNVVGGENYLFIVTPISVTGGYAIRVRKRDGTIIHTTQVNYTNAQNQQRFTITPADTSECYCDIGVYDYPAGATSVTVNIDIKLEYTQSQGISELWSKVNEATQIEPRVGALETLTSDQQQEIDKLNGAMNNVVNSFTTIKPYLYKRNVYINAAGIETSLSGYDLYLIPLSVGDIVQFKWLTDTPFYGSLNYLHVFSVLNSNTITNATQGTSQSDHYVPRPGENIKEAIFYGCDTIQGAFVSVKSGEESKIEVYINSVYPIINNEGDTYVKMLSKSNCINGIAYIRSTNAFYTLATDGYYAVWAKLKAGDKISIEGNLSGVHNSGVFRDVDGDYSVISNTPSIFTAEKDGLFCGYLANEQTRAYVYYPNNSIKIEAKNVVGLKGQSFQGLDGVAFGTSLTYRAQTTGGYLQYLPNLSGITFDNQGIGSATIMSGILNAVKNYDGYANKRVALLEGFVNDWYGHNPIGTYKDTDETTACGCVRSAITYMLSQNQNLTIFLVLDPYGRNYNNVDCSSTAVNASGLTQFEYYEEIAKVGESLGIPVIKEYAESQISENTPQYLIDNIHPNPLGAMQSANFIWSKMQNYSPNAVN